MFRNLLKIFLRQLLKHRIFSLINIIGLSVALTACLLINSFVSYELSYDRHYTHAERLYQVASRLRSADQRNEISATSGLLAPLLKENVPEIEEVARLSVFAAALARDDKVFQEEKLGFADSSLFALFDLRWTLGDPDSALVDPGSIVLTQSLARKYFGGASPLGETLLLENSVVVSVTGVIEDLPPNTHLDFSALLPLQQLEPLHPVSGVLDSWNVSDVATYLLLKPGVEDATVAAQLSTLVEQYDPVPPDVVQTREVVIKKVTSVHLHPELGDEATGSMTTVVVFSITALSILLIAVINFVNLAISRYAARAREVGVRKSAGASKTELMLQFCGEAILLALGAMLVAVAGAEMMMPVLEALTGSPIPFTHLGDPLSALALLALAVLLGLVAGLYPAWYFASVQTAAALGGKTSSGKSALHLRNALVMFQFAAAIFIIVVTLVIHLQMQHVDSLDMGYEPELIVELPTPPEWDQNYASFWELFKAQLLADPGISSVTHSRRDFMSLGGFITQFRAGPANEARRIASMSVGHDFFSTYQVRFLSGRDFSPAMPTDDLFPTDINNPGATLSGSFILSELAAQEFGWTPEEAVGQALYYGNSGVAGTVIGVVSNTLRSSKDLLRPVAYSTPRNGRYGSIGGSISLKVSRDNLQQTLAHIDTTWAGFFPAEPVTRFFLQDQIDAEYLTEIRQASLFRYFALLSIVLSCMGLFGLAAFNAERRTREIGVRKVMGGSVWSIVLLLTNDFSKLVLISNVIAWPLAYVVMNRWLENFAHRIDLTPLIFIGSGLIALCIAWITVGGTAAKAASQKPVLALRYE